MCCVLFHVVTVAVLSARSGFSWSKRLPVLRLCGIFHSIQGSSVAYICGIQYFPAASEVDVSECIKVRTAPAAEMCPVVRLRHCVTAVTIFYFFG